jgi:hypothetical protein
VTPAEARFLLPRSVGSAVVLGDLPGWREGLTEAGIRLADEASGGDLVVASHDQLTRAFTLEPDMLIVQGRSAGRRVREAGLRVGRFLPLPDTDAPELFLPLEQAAPAAYALDGWAMPPTRLKDLRNRAVKALLARGRFPSLRPLLTVAVRDPGLPFVLAAAASLGIPSDSGWVLTPGRGDVLSRGLFSVFPSGSAVPVWAVKFARVPGYEESFDRDARGLAMAASAEVVARHAPKLLGRFEAEGLHASLETAAVGRRLTGFLHSFASRQARLRIVDRIAGWIVDLGSATAQPSEAVGPERDRLAREVLPAWVGAGAPPGLLEELPAVPGVLQHNDLGCWNLVVEGSEFTAVDWESARASGFPLWDLWYFLADATGHLEGAEGPHGRLRHFVRLFRGEEATSSILWRWTRRAAETMSIPEAALGPLATLCWLHHGRSHVARATALSDHAPGSAPAPTTASRMAELWLEDPGLGVSWTALGPRSDRP